MLLLWLMQMHGAILDVYLGVLDHSLGLLTMDVIDNLQVLMGTPSGAKDFLKESAVELRVDRVVQELVG